MFEKHSRRYQKGASFVPHITRNRLVFKPPRVAGWCKTPRILQLSSLFAHLGAFGNGKSLIDKQLLNESGAQTTYQNSTATRSICSWPLSGRRLPGAAAVTD